MNPTKDGRDPFERMAEQKRNLDAYFMQAIQDAAGDSVIRKAPAFRTTLPNRDDYPNRAAFRRACAEWRRSHDG